MVQDAVVDLDLVATRVFHVDRAVAVWRVTLHTGTDLGRWSDSEDLFVVGFVSAISKKIYVLWFLNHLDRRFRFLNINWAI